MSHQSKLKKIREYRIWTNMKNRCSNPRNPAYVWYGARGITVCDEWRDSFGQFLADMGRCPDGFTIERRNNDLGYSRGNCVWLPAELQQRNRRSVRLLTHEGKTQTVAEWGRELSIPAGTILSRIRHSNSNVLSRKVQHKKLSDSQVDEIRSRLSAGERHAAIAALFGVDRSTITAISCGKNWKDSKNPRVIVSLEAA